MNEHSAYLRDLTTGSEWDKPSNGTCEKLTAAAAHIDAQDAKIKALVEALGVIGNSSLSLSALADEEMTDAIMNVIHRSRSMTVAEAAKVLLGDADAVSTITRVIQAQYAGRVLISQSGVSDGLSALSKGGE